MKHNGLGVVLLNRGPCLSIRPYLGESDIKLLSYIKTLLLRHLNSNMPNVNPSVSWLAARIEPRIHWLAAYPAAIELISPLVILVILYEIFIRYLSLAKHSWLLNVTNSRRKYVNHNINMYIIFLF